MEYWTSNIRFLDFTRIGPECDLLDQSCEAVKLRQKLRSCKWQAVTLRSVTGDVTQALARPLKQRIMRKP